LHQLRELKSASLHARINSLRTMIDEDEKLRAIMIVDDSDVTKKPIEMLADLKTRLEVLSVVTQAADQSREKLRADERSLLDRRTKALARRANLASLTGDDLGPQRQYDQCIAAITMQIRTMKQVLERQQRLLSKHRQDIDTLELKLV
jgi:hypothetical protein